MLSLFGENLIDDFFNEFAHPVRRTTGGYHASAPSVMRTDVKESKAGYDLDIDLPGYKKENVKAELKDGYLTVSAENKVENDQKDDDGRYIRRERYYGTCSRSFFVGENITQEDIKARFEDGILKIFVPKKEEKPAVEETKYIAIEG